MIYYDIASCKSFFEFINTVEKKYKDRIAFSSRVSNVTYQEFCQMVRHCAAYFSQFKRRNILVDITDSLHFAIAFFSVVVSGNVAVVVPEKECQSLKIEDYLPVSFEDIETILRNETTPICFFSDPSIVCTIVCSSGTTSVKKGVMLSQRNILSCMRGGMQQFLFSQGSVYLNVLPYSHMFGIVADLLAPLYSGGTICQSRNKMSFFEDLFFFKPTNLNLPPAMISSMHHVLLETNRFDVATGGRLKKIMCAGASYDEHLSDAFNKYGIEIYVAYGLTECSPCVSMSGESCYKKGSVGKPIPCCRVEIVDGEIVVSGENVMLGYYDEPELTKSVLRNSKLYTGDLGFLDSDGFLFLSGRKSNIIVFSSGIKINVEDIEQTINVLPGVVESIVSPVKNSDKISITVVSNEEGREHLLTKIKEVLKEADILFCTQNIRIQALPLQRSVLGKIIRSNVYESKILGPTQSHDCTT